MAQREPVARIEASLPMDGQECAKRRPSHGGSRQNVAGATMVAFDNATIEPGDVGVQDLSGPLDIKLRTDEDA
jgi:hypothetical protein